MKRPAALGLVALSVAAACGGADPAGDPAACGEPDVALSLQPLSSFDCSESVDTGYTSGTPFDITVVTVDGKPVERSTANAYWVMAQAAAADGVEIRVVSGFRTMAEQEYLYGCYVNCNCNSCNLAAKPGYSNHQSGHALDLNTSAGGVYEWLEAHGGDYGFTRTVPSEKWHWEWWGGGPGGGQCGGCTPHCEGTTIVGGDCGQGDCAAYGATCVDDALGVRCVSVFCPAQGTAKVCVDDSTIMDCQDGNPVGTGDCSAYAAWCSTAHGGGPRCVSVFCVASPSELPAPHDVCLPDGRLAHCNAEGGVENAVDCPASEPCTADGEGARCGKPAGSGTGGAGGDGAGGTAGGSGAGSGGGEAGTGWTNAAGAPPASAGGSGGTESVQQSRVVDAGEGGCACRGAAGRPDARSWLGLLGLLGAPLRRRSPRGSRSA